MSLTANAWPALPPESASAIELLEWGILEFGERLGICTSFGAGPGGGNKTPIKPPVSPGLNVAFTSPPTAA